MPRSTGVYTPAAFEVNDPTLIGQFIRQHPFGILLSSADGSSIQDSHTPFLLSNDQHTLTGHIARANGHWKDWSANPRVKVIFHGPHCYVSPADYQSDFNVPTWNYTAVSVDGDIEIVDDPGEQLSFMHSLVAEHEPAGGDAAWSLDESDDKMMSLLDAVVFFRIRISNIQAKFKLNQNKSAEDRNRVIEKLLKSSSAFDRSVGALMRDFDG